VLVEKSKTTPDIYPMTLNSIKTASNQKSNRSPLMDLREDQVEEVLYELRQMGAVIEVHSGGRVPKFKHQLYEWLGVEKVELSVMAELLLRGEQTIGDLRARASRMDRIEGLPELKPILASLIEKNLVVELTSPGRGQIVTHNLYQPEELTRLKSQYQDGAAGVSAEAGPATASIAKSNPAMDDRLDQLAEEVQDLRQTVDELRQKISQIDEMLK
jgi:uncharacterized protein YceH (UPF0502 family)